MTSLLNNDGGILSSGQAEAFVCEASRKSSPLPLTIGDRMYEMRRDRMYEMRRPVLLVYNDNASIRTAVGAR